MKLTRPDVDLFIPDAAPLEDALGRTTHLGIGAHQDDLEFMALHGILECFGRSDRWFTGVTVTNGAGSARTGDFGRLTDEEMVAVRIEEQREAARHGRYSCQIQLLYPSSDLKDAACTGPVRDLRSILCATRPEVVYLHSPADKHDTHVACCLRSIAALRDLPAGDRPKAVYGCEVWRDLDWLMDADKVVLPLDDPHDLGPALSGLFRSQIAGGKRYDLAVQGRRLANATFFESHEVDRHHQVSFAMDLTPLVVDVSVNVAEYTRSFMERTIKDIRDRLTRMG